MSETTEPSEADLVSVLRTLGIGSVRDPTLSGEPGDDPRDRLSLAAALLGRAERLLMETEDQAHAAGLPTGEIEAMAFDTLEAGSVVESEELEAILHWRAVRLAWLLQQLPKPTAQPNPLLAAAGHAASAVAKLLAARLLTSQGDQPAAIKPLVRAVTALDAAPAALGPMLAAARQLRQQQHGEQDPPSAT